MSKTILVVDDKASVLREYLKKGYRVVSESRFQRHGESGLRLAIAAAHGGRISAESEPRRGCLHSITLAAVSSGAK